jgi:hypothetical protein
MKCSLIRDTILSRTCLLASKRYKTSNSYRTRDSLTFLRSAETFSIIVGVVITLNPGSVSTISDALCHCNSNICLFQSWSIINTVSPSFHRYASFPSHNLIFVFWKHPSEAMPFQSIHQQDEQLIYHYRATKTKGTCLYPFQALNLKINMQI